jgi:hypothetical protein
MKRIPRSIQTPVWLGLPLVSWLFAIVALAGAANFVMVGLTTSGK